MTDPEGEEGALAEGGGGGGECIEGLGVPFRKASPSRFPLQLRARITGLAGFPLQSLTRRRDKVDSPSCHVMFVKLILLLQ